MNKFFIMIIGLLFTASAVFASPNAKADFVTLDKVDSQVLFGDSAVSVVALSHDEMMATEGEWAPIVFYAGRYGFKLAYHGAHHTFKYIGRSQHLQMNMWQKGVSNSGKSLFRVPWRWWR